MRPAGGRSRRCRPCSRATWTRDAAAAAAPVLPFPFSTMTTVRERGTLAVGTGAGLRAAGFVCGVGASTRSWAASCKPIGERSHERAAADHDQQQELGDSDQRLRCRPRFATGG